MIYDDHVDFEDFATYQLSWKIIHDGGEAMVAEWTMPQEAYDKYFKVAHADACVSFSLDETIRKIFAVSKRRDNSFGSQLATKLIQSFNLPPAKIINFHNNFDWSSFKECREKFKTGVDLKEFSQEELKKKGFEEDVNRTRAK
jgi:hypothetical protein